MVNMYYLKHKTISFGCDPEFFFTVQGKTIGAEKIIPKKGIKYKAKTTHNTEGGYTAKGTESKIIIDGVQAELNPRANTCRANLGNEISQCFRELYKKMQKNKSVKADFSQMIEITQEEMDSLDASSKQFGCMPSYNTYGENKIKVKDASKYLKRSAGGHLHIGFVDTDTEKLLNTRTDEVVKVLDIILGNTCVLIDRDKGNIERRKNYGRAGEYRKPKHGLEYRTLSNFWLKSYQLMSFVTGMARLAVCIVASDLTNEITSKVNEKDIQKAINKNDFKLAYKNYNAIKNTLTEITQKGDYPITKDTQEAFEYFIKMGVDHWFKEDPMEHWIKLPEGHETGWESFLNKIAKEIKEKQNANNRS